MKGLLVLLSSPFFILYARLNPFADENWTDLLKVDTIAKRLMSNHGKVEKSLTCKLCLDFKC